MGSGLAGSKGEFGKLHGPMRVNDLGEGACQKRGQNAKNDDGTKGVRAVHRRVIPSGNEFSLEAADMQQIRARCLLSKAFGANSEWRGRIGRC